MTTFARKISSFEVCLVKKVVTKSKQVNENEHNMNNYQVLQV